MIYLDNAATSGKKPSGVIKAVETALRNYSANPGRSGHNVSMEASYRIYNIRMQFSELFGAKGPEAVVFTSNCTLALNCVIKGVLKAGDHVIISDIEHNAVLRPVHKMFTDGIITYDTAKIDFFDEDATVNNFKNLIRPNTKMIICSHASNVCGIISPIEKIGKLCREKGIVFTVDAAQSAGIIDIDMKKMNIDYLAIAAHKGLYAPMGVGVLIANRPIENTIIEGGTGTSSMSRIQPEDMPERLESGTVNLPGIMGAGAGINYVKSIGIDRIYLHEIKLIQQLYYALSSMKKVKLYTPFPQTRRFAPVLSFNIDGMSSTDISSALNEKGIAVRAGYHCAPLAIEKLSATENGTVRVSTGSFNTKNDINYLVNMIKFL